ncbi:MAG: ribosome maturation factor RimM [Hyphomonadaceae bacterium]
MAEKKSALTKPKAAAKAAPAAAKKAAPAPRRGEPAPKKAVSTPAKAMAKAKPEPKAKAAAPKPAAKAAPTPKTAPAAKAPAAKPAAKATAKAAKPEKKAAKTAPAPKAAANAVKPEPKAKAAPPKPAKAAKPAPEPKKPAKAAKPAPEPKPAKAKAEKPPKAPKPAKAPKPPKPPKLAPVAAALAKPIPAKPMAVAAGRAQPITRAPLPTPVRTVPKPLASPKPVSEPEVAGDLKDVPAFKAKSTASKGMILVGAIAGAYGVKGEVRLRAFTERSEGVISYGPLHDETGKVLLKPKSWRELKEGVAVVAPEIKSKEQADKMKGVKLFVPRANLPAPAKDEFYVVDLLGSRAESLDGTVLGDIVAVWNFGAGDILEYKPPNGGPNVRVTFTKEAVPHVDLNAKRVVLDPPAPEPIEK